MTPLVGKLSSEVHAVTVRVEAPPLAPQARSRDHAWRGPVSVAPVAADLTPPPLTATFTHLTPQMNRLVVAVETSLPPELHPLAALTLNPLAPIDAVLLALAEGVAPVLAAGVTSPPATAAMVVVATAVVVVGVGPHGGATTTRRTVTTMRTTASWTPTGLTWG